MEQSRLWTIEVAAYVTLVVGTLGDHLSTSIALESPNVYETNQFTVFLMSKGLWLPFDLLMIGLGIGIPYLLVRIKKTMRYRAVVAYPLVLGIIRLCAAVWNFSIT